MNSCQFPNCCGAKIVKDFGGTINAIYDRKYTVEEIDLFLKMNAPDDSPVSYIAILNDAQRNKFKNVFRDNGFKMKSKFWHRNHNNFCYYYIKNPPTPKNAKAIIV